MAIYSIWDSGGKFHLIEADSCYEREVGGQCVVGFINKDEDIVAAFVNPVAIMLDDAIAIPTRIAS